MFIIKEQLKTLWAYFTKVEQYALMGLAGAVPLAMFFDWVKVAGVAKVFGFVGGICMGVVVLSLGWRNVLKKRV